MEVCSLTCKHLFHQPFAFAQARQLPSSRRRWYSEYSGLVCVLRARMGENQAIINEIPHAYPTGARLAPFDRQ